MTGECKNCKCLTCGKNKNPLICGNCKDCTGKFEKVTCDEYERMHITYEAPYGETRTGKVMNITTDGIYQVKDTITGNKVELSEQNLR